MRGIERLTLTFQPRADRRAENDSYDPDQALLDGCSASSQETRTVQDAAAIR